MLLADAPSYGEDTRFDVLTVQAREPSQIVRASCEHCAVTEAQKWAHTYSSGDGIYARCADLAAAPGHAWK